RSRWDSSVLLCDERACQLAVFSGKLPSMGAEILQPDYNLTSPLECPDCGLLNPPGAMRCDCGYDFTIGKAMNEAVRVPTTKKSYNFQSAALLTKQILFFGCAAAGVGLARQGFYSLSYTSGLEAWLFALVGCAIAPPSAYAFWRTRRRRLRL